MADTVDAELAVWTGIERPAARLLTQPIDADLASGAVCGNPALWLHITRHIGLHTHARLTDQARRAVCVRDAGNRLRAVVGDADRARAAVRVDHAALVERAAAAARYPEQSHACGPQRQRAYKGLRVHGVLCSVRGSREEERGRARPLDARSSRALHPNTQPVQSSKFWGGGRLGAPGDPGAEALRLF